MVFIHVESDGHEWGYWSDFVPSPGDTVMLWYALPDNDCEDAIACTVTSRTVYAGGDEEDTVVIVGDLALPIPDGYVPDSPAWPSVEYTERRRALALELLELYPKQGDHIRAKYADVL